MNGRPSPRTYTPAEHDLIDQMRRDGATFQEIGDVLGRKNGNVARYAARHGLHERRRHLSSRDRVGIVAMYAERRPINEIRRRYSVTATTIYRIIHAEGIPVHCPGRAAVLRKAALARHTRTRTGGCP